MAWQTKWRSNKGDWKGTSARGSSTALLAFWVKPLTKNERQPAEVASDQLHFSLNI
jgi:hypothetical protein